MYSLSKNSSRDRPLAISTQFQGEFSCLQRNRHVQRLHGKLRSARYLKSIVFHSVTIIMTATMPPSHWEGIQRVILCRNMPGVDISALSCVELRRQSRKLESEIDQKLVSFSKLSTSYGQRETSQ